MKDNTKLPWNSAEEFYDLHANAFFASGNFYHSNMIGQTDEDFSKYIISKLDLKSTDSVVDLGCGSGYLVNEISKICKCVGISNSKSSIQLAKTNFPGSQFEIADMENYQAGGVTHFLSLESIGYSNVNNTLNNVYQNLSNNGVLYIKDISFVSNPNELEAENLNYWVEYWKYKTHTVAEMISSAYKIGFKLNAFRDLHLDSRLNLKSFMDTLKNNIVPEAYPHPDVPVHIGTEFVFQKKSRERWVNPYI
jgi:cyclopropane fatty-acyl-phospholipid synthase-like methyltransferase